MFCHLLLASVHHICVICVTSKVISDSYIVSGTSLLLQQFYLQSAWIDRINVIESRKWVMKVAEYRFFYKNS